MAKHFISNEAIKTPTKIIHGVVSRNKFFSTDGTGFQHWIFFSVVTKQPHKTQSQCVQMNLIPNILLSHIKKTETRQKLHVIQKCESIFFDQNHR